VIAQASVPVHPSDTPQTLADRILEVEHQLYPEALKLLARDEVKLQNGLAVFS
jgi:phosphoribosylglycinamide formyltransferase-1